LFDTYLSTMLQQIGADTAMALVLALQSDRTGTAMPQRPVLCEKVSPSTLVLERGSIRDGLKKGAAWLWLYVEETMHCHYGREKKWIAQRKIN